MLENMIDKDKLYFFRYGIYAFLLIVLLGIMFILGNRVACNGGYTDGLTCVNPKVVELVQVCEYNNYNCVSKCQDFMIHDREAFNRLYHITALPDERNN